MPCKENYSNKAIFTKIELCISLFMADFAVMAAGVTEPPKYVVYRVISYSNMYIFWQTRLTISPTVSVKCHTTLIFVTQKDRINEPSTVIYIE